MGTRNRPKKLLRKRFFRHYSPLLFFERNKKHSFAHIFVHARSIQAPLAYKKTTSLEEVKNQPPALPGPVTIDLPQYESSDRFTYWEEALNMADDDDEDEIEDETGVVVLSVAQDEIKARRCLAAMRRLWGEVSASSTPTFVAFFHCSPSLCVHNA